MYIYIYIYKLNNPLQQEGPPRKEGTHYIQLFLCIVYTNLGGMKRRCSMVPQPAPLCQTCGRPGGTRRRRSRSPPATASRYTIQFARTVTSDEVPPELQLRPASRPDRIADVVVQFLDSIATMQSHNMQFQQSMMEQQMHMQAQNMNLMQQLLCNGKGYLMTI